ncbi:BREX system P-loop protein BrxC [Bifidobacterium platyrrhinorum]|uniref:BREX system P-loop protein BrxC n=1 Tax=Bifidobacterium platyrrhinorum TaxID=2661628 RepID=A0A6L9SUH3_9BIFI|nr:BREX system P-loop protein BrxC [Bifidobacterium platyrrhinorum]NEG54811.1 BREX system P-loop protein BrxC [Bifidobacterium platyrrhinorum]
MSDMGKDTGDALQLRDVFVKNIDDKIDGVIKAGDDSNLVDEVREYVLTNEIQTNLERFLDAYNDPFADYTNGVWISGYFGSGKSHLLKMLSHILGDVPAAAASAPLPDGGEPLSRAQVIDIMKSKAGDAGNHELEGLLDANACIPATSLLFNIDSKAQRGSRTALLDAFIRVFDEARGYYGANKYVAKMEHDLEANGRLDEFARQFETIAGKPWSKGRVQAAFSGAKIDKAFAAVTGDEVNGILKDYQRQYNPTIADFADDVDDWLRHQPDDHRLVFLVDEVGQFVGTDTDRMLNLQTVTEELFSRTKGRAWVIVTSQEDIDSVIGDRTVSQGLDFTKIKGRFAVNLKLSSADAIEVIQKRLLTKNERGETAVGELWREHRDELDALFTFQGDGARQFNNRRFGTEEDFTATYPFVNYQFTLFQDAMRGMSAAGFFEGQHRSVGERSLLSTVSSALVERKNDMVGALMPFSALYDGIAGTIQSSVNHRINEVERELGSETRELALPLLKALLLVKHVKGFKATVRNLRILILGRFGEDLPELERRIQDTLDLLERQNYVHRTGDLYEYLTNDEQEVESEIRNLDIEDRRIRERLGRIVEETIGQPVVEYGSGRNRTKFRYGLIVDGVAQGKSYPIMLHVVTPMVDLPQDVKILRSSGERGELHVIFDEDASKLMRDLTMVERTEKYLRLHANEQGARKRIIDDKRGDLGAMYQELKATVAQALRSAAIAYNGAVLETKIRQDAAGIVTEAMQTLIGRLYTNLGMVEGLAYAEKDLPGVLADASVPVDASQLSIGAGADTVRNRLDSPAQDVFDYVAGQARRNLASTVRDVTRHYEDEPYGWPFTVTLACLCHLVGSDRIRLMIDSRRVPRTDVVKSLINQKTAESVLVEIPKRHDAAKLRELREFAADYLGMAGDRLPSDAEDMARAIKEGLLAEAHAIETLRAANGRFGFVASLDGPLKRIRDVAAKSEEWILESFPSDDEDDGTERLLDDKEDVVDPIRKVLNGKQRDVLSDGLDWIASNDPNFTLAPTELQQERDAVRAIADDPKLFQDNKVNVFRTRLTALQEHLAGFADKERGRAADVVARVRETLTGSDSYRAAREGVRREAMRSLDEATAKIRDAKYVADIRQTADHVRDDLSLKLFNRLDAAKEKPEPVAVAPSAGAPKHASASQAESEVSAGSAEPGASSSSADEGSRRPDSEPSDRFIRVTPPRSKSMLCTEADVDEFLDTYRRKLIASIKEGKRILL